jgi:hypothetical protein
MIFFNDSSARVPFSLVVFAIAFSSARSAIDACLKGGCGVHGG